MPRPRTLRALAAGLAVAAAAHAAPGLTLAPLALPWGSNALPIAPHLANPVGASNVSGACVVDLGGRRFLAAAVDEGTEVTLVALDGPEPGRVHVVDVLDAAGQAGETDEVDLEGVDFRDGVLWVMGSSTLKRKKPRPELDRSENLARLLTVVPVSGGEKGDWNRHSDRLYGFRVTLERGAPALELVSRPKVRKRLRKDKLLSRFTAIPSKEGGVDLEGLAVHDGRLLLGMRGPVLRGHAVVATFDEAEGRGEDADDDLAEGMGRPFLRFLALGGYGIRSMEAMDHPAFGRGVFLVAGPTLDAIGPFRLYRWDGDSDHFGAAGPGLELLGEFSAPDPTWKAEGLFAFGDDLVLAFDGPEGGALHTLRR